MHHQPVRIAGRIRTAAGASAKLALAIIAAVSFSGDADRAATVFASELRMTPLVRAVQQARPSIVNIHGEKLVQNDFGPPTGENRRRVNGMGTGIVIDERGYIITNHHVVDGVKRILVTSADDHTFVAQLISHDMKTDLAIIKIDSPEPLPVIRIGTSADLMPGETVVAIGNAYGYEHSVTDGIISALHRSVQVSDTQSYDDLIQTSAAINPGNSGGPLLNIDGEMIGINVAVRAGAQNIGFAIPIDKALGIASDLLSTRRIDRTWHGMIVDTAPKGTTEGAVLKEIALESPAAAGGLKSGDIIKTIGSKSVQRILDVERALIGLRPGTSVPVTIVRNNETQTLNLSLASLPGDGPHSNAAHTTTATATDRFWDVLGLRLEAVPQRQFQTYRSRYRGGLIVTDVRPEGPAAKQGIRRGDVLVGMHIWETVTIDNVNYVLDRPDFTQIEPLKFYILRGNETLYGHLTVARKTP